MEDRKVLQGGILHGHLVRTKYVCNVHGCGTFKHTYETSVWRVVLLSGVLSFLAGSIVSWFFSH
jgi:hypothetical protein